MILTKVLFVILGLIGYSSAKVEPKLKCTPELMQVEIPATPQTKSVYLQGLRDYPDPACKPQANPEGTAYVFGLNLTNVFQCGITRVISHLTGRHVYYKTIIVETTGPLQQVDEIQVKCSISPVTNHTVNKRNVLPAGFQELEDFDSIESVIKHAPVPTLGVGVRQSGKLVTGELNVSPGTPLQMEIYLDKNSSAIYGLLVTHMQVTDTKSQEETIIYNGCSVDPYLFDNFNTVDGDFLSAKFKAFKFPDSTYVQFKGTVNVCLDKCKGIECSDGQVGYGRKRRSLPTLPADPNKIFEITITSFIKVNYEDESENFEEMIKNQEKLYNNKKFIVGSEMDKKIYKTIDETPSNLGMATLVEEEKVSSIYADSAAFCEKSVSVAVVFVGLLCYFL